MKITLVISLLTVAIVLTGCVNTETEPPQDVPEPVEQTIDQDQEDKSPQEDDEPKSNLEPEEAANIIVQLLQNKEMEALAELVHPTEGMRFSPYGYIDVENNLVFTPDQIKELWEDETVHHWGQFDGTGEPITMVFSEYYDRFVYDQDYLNAEKISVNERAGQGNTLDNSQEIYPNATIIEYHFSGFEEQYDGMDWRSLRLVLEQDKEQWFLVGIIHDEWTT